MDQVKVYLGLLKKYHFWLLSVIVVIASLVSWSVSSGKLAAEFERDKAQVDGAANGLKGVLGDGNPPNPKFTAKVEGEHKGLKSNVFTAWQELYESQVSQFVWPKEMPDLANYARGDKEIPRERRAYYNENVVRAEWEALLDEVPVRRIEEDDEADEEEGPRKGSRYVGIVEWSKSQQKAIIDRYYSKGIPSDLSVRLTQEDLWVFRTLVELVNQMNQVAIAQMELGIHDPLMATIKRIDKLDLAQWAIVDAQSDPTSLVASTGEGSGTGGGQPGGAGGAMPGGAGGPAAGGAGGPAAGGAGQGGAQDGDEQLLNGRYLDENGQPLAASAAKTPTSGPFAEFKQIFVYMKFVMDQRKVPDLLAACANSTLPIETRQVRIRPIGGSTSGSGARGGGGMFNGGAGNAGGPGAGAMPGNAGNGGGGGAAGDLAVTPYDMLVDVSGIIYLYNPPGEDPEKSNLGKGTARSPGKRSFGVPTGTVQAPRAASGK